MIADNDDEWWRENLTEIAESLTEYGWHRALSCALATEETALSRSGPRLPLRATYEQCRSLLRSLPASRLDALLNEHCPEQAVQLAREDILEGTWRRWQ